MKTLIVAINSKYIHSSLAPWYLKSYCGDECGKIKVLEFTINDNVESIFSAIYLEKPDVLAFSTYIWNVSHVLSLAGNIKKVLPEVCIILGGPEVSFESVKIMEDNPSIDYIIAGEGEVPMKLLLKSLAKTKGYTGKIGVKGTCQAGGMLNEENSDSMLDDDSILDDKSIESVENIPGLTYRKEGEIFQNSFGKAINPLDLIPSPYNDEMAENFKDKIVYYESSRGCPFSCSYCLSSTFSGVRFFSMERVKSDLMRLINLKVHQVKFVDRTFNCNRERAKEIFKFIMENALEDGGKPITNFHFEIAGDLFDEEMHQILSAAPEGLIQFEIGIQTTNEETLELIDRKTDTEIVFENVRKLRKCNNIHLHLDLIAGLPKEDLRLFKNSFNEVYGLKPHNLQLGFLKMLNGTKIKREAELYGYRYKNFPPYEVLSNDFISYDEIIELKGIENVLERYYNSGRFVETLNYLIYASKETPYDFYKELSDFFKTNGYLERRLSSRELYTIILQFCRRKNYDLNIVNELLKYDFLRSDNTNNLPEGIQRHMESGFKEKCFDFLSREENIDKYLPQYKGMAAKQIYKNVHFEIFSLDVTEDFDAFREITPFETVILFDYGSKNKVSGLYYSVKIDF